LDLALARHVEHAAVRKAGCLEEAREVAHVARPAFELHFLLDQAASGAAEASVEGRGGRGNFAR